MSTPPKFQLTLVFRLTLSPIRAQSEMAHLDNNKSIWQVMYISFSLSDAQAACDYVEKQHPVKAIIEADMDMVTLLITASQRCASDNRRLGRVEQNAGGPVVLVSVGLGRVRMVTSWQLTVCNSFSSVPSHRFSTRLDCWLHLVNRPKKVAANSVEIVCKWRWTLIIVVGLAHLLPHGSPQPIPTPSISAHWTSSHIPPCPVACSLPPSPHISRHLLTSIEDTP
ncbi:unnamed protein product [Protopolystoma xenopodis]|uniref:Uncharacterized protein n=1 Tax=Protopolystoma xenopodis TaxID=117903 RepID=A0A3S5FD51_9PLAT|nr:unnamed protein product [Protopolystoma xenopodis]